MPFGNQRSSGGVFISLSELPRESSPQELMNCQNALPSATEWFIVKPMKTPSRSSVTCTASNGCDMPW
uniref:Uncharacterized protein n=1 Tax=Lotus japonicus TaxID=34305 RepID=I3T3S0_LOTJA|nr:unknown [Lotus japonicus]